MRSNDTKLNIGIMSFKILSDWSGVERVASDIAFAMDNRGHKISIIVPSRRVKPGKSVPVMPLPENCDIIELPLNDNKQLDDAKNILRQSDVDVVIAMFGNRELLWTPWLLSDSNIPLLISESINPDVLTYERWNPYEHYGTLMAADHIQVLLPSFKEQYPLSLQNRIEVIGNPSPPPAKIDLSVRNKKKDFTLLAVGRFEERQKQFTLLLRAWNLLYPKFSDWSLKIVGDGPQNDLYRAMAKAMGKNARISFTGSVNDVGPHYADSDIFCMPSRYEGFGLVLTEAASYALPLVGLSTCEAAAELITSEVGMLAKPDCSGADTPESLASTLQKLMSTSQQERINMGENARDILGKRFAADIIYDKWENLLFKTASKKGHTKLNTFVADKWNSATLGESVIEIINRSHPLDKATIKEGMEASIIARLQSENEMLQKDHQKLQEKYSSILKQLKGGSNRRR